MADCSEAGNVSETVTEDVTDNPGVNICYKFALYFSCNE